MHITKNLETSKARPGPPKSGPHQSLTSALPVKAWHITMALSRFGESFPLVLYARGIFCNVTPDSSVKEGMIAIVWSGIKAANGFSGCCCVLSYSYSATNSFVWRGNFGERLTISWEAGAIGLRGSCHLICCMKNLLFRKRGVHCCHGGCCSIQCRPV